MKRVNWDAPLYKGTKKNSMSLTSKLRSNVETEAKLQTAGKDH